MARQVTVDLSDTINSWRVKTNTIAAQIGDLDNLDSSFAGNDSNVVSALSNVRLDTKAGHGLNQTVDSGLELADMPANTIKVRDANSTGRSSDKAVTNEQILIGDGTGFTAAALSQDVLMTNAGVVTIQDNVVTNAKLADMAGHTIKTRQSSTSGDPGDLAIPDHSVIGRSAAGDIGSVQAGTNTVIGRTSSGGITAGQVTTGQIADDAVTNDKLANMTANSVKVNANGSAAGPVDLVINADRVLGRDSAGNLSSLQVNAGMLHSVVTLVIYNSAGTAVKTLHGAGS